MMFSELYGAYYNAVANILKSAVNHSVSKDEIRAIAEKYAFEESVYNVESSLADEKWQLLKNDGTTPIEREPSMPLSKLQKQWLKAVMLDPRIKLFVDDFSRFPDLSDVEPLFTQDDICVFDKYSDGDNFENEDYIKNFRLILDAVKNEYPLSVCTKNRYGKLRQSIVLPKYLEYSEKDDKFRLYSSGKRGGKIFNLARIVECAKCENLADNNFSEGVVSENRSVEFDLVDERNALERVLLHFAHFEKQAEKLGDNRYHITVNYDRDDETEVLIRILSFGPKVKVTAPESFVNLIIERLKQQKSCEQF